MKLNLEGKEDLRRRVNEKLKDVELNPEARVKLPLDVLEELLFDEKIGKDGFKYRKVGFITDNLHKLDLSEVSFKDVSFYDVKARREGKKIDLSNTNVKIDFSESYEYKMFKTFRICNFNLENVNLSNNDFVTLTEKEEGLIKDCNLRNTKLSLPDNIKVTGSDLSNNNFSTLTLTVGEPNDGEYNHFENDYDVKITNTNLTNTRANIIVSKLAELEKRVLNETIAKGYLDGCTINGTVIMSKIEKKEQAVSEQKKYEKFVSNEINRVIHLIDENRPTAGGRQLNLKRITKK